ncbi:Gfo/Idh/MocA family protein [Cupriavidus basilensis]|uniref:Gfo/Idh/MocA family protein n=1 Tax=Cupriavidus basilensis TaxID=68895 RepID=UPI0023E75A1F|nr:Gfo/Idh/MocA family oxidoreductase [Cupriavidus basilensis]MDF3881444.1 Gfo/Idh/MocA family oxidoreductase [Cupriavidus basilensis]
MNKIRVAVIGPGRISRAHLNAIRNNADVAQLSSVVGLPHEHERTVALAKEFGADKASDDLALTLSDPEIDAIVLTVPNHLHRDVAIQAMRAGKHVLVEKPLANSVEDADAMIAEANATGRLLMVAQCRRFFAGAALAKKRIRELGRPLDITHVLGVFVDDAKVDWWRSASKAGGLAIGLNGPHVVDTILWLMGEQPVRVYTQTTRLKPEKWEGEDQATIVLTFADGSIATGHLSLNMRAHVNERWMVGPKGCMQLTNDRTLTLNGDTVVSAELTPYIDGDESFDGQFREFAMAIREGRSPLCSAVEVRPVVAVLAAALESASRNMPIELGAS